MYGSDLILFRGTPDHVSIAPRQSTFRICAKFHATPFSLQLLIIVNIKTRKVSGLQCYFER